MGTWYSLIILKGRSKTCALSLIGYLTSLTKIQPTAPNSMAHSYEVTPLICRSTDKSRDRPTANLKDREVIVVRYLLQQNPVKAQLLLLLPIPYCSDDGESSISNVKPAFFVKRWKRPSPKAEPGVQKPPCNSA